MNKPKFWTSDKIISISAFLISLATLFTLMFQTRLMQKQQYASALPHLMIGDSYSNQSFSLSLVNNGVGPAFIQDIKIYYDGKSFDHDPASFLRTIMRENNSESINFHWTLVSKGRVLPAGKSIEMIGVQNSAKDADKLLKIFVEEAVVEIIYTSIYDETWRVKGLAGVPEKLDD